MLPSQDNGKQLITGLKRDFVAYSINSVYINTADDTNLSSLARADPLYLQQQLLISKHTSSLLIRR